MWFKIQSNKSFHFFILLIGDMKMKAFFIIVIILLAVFFLSIVFFALKSHKFLKTMGLNSLLGLMILALIDLTGKFTGIYIPINLYTVAGSGIFGIPAVCGFLILQILFAFP